MKRFEAEPRAETPTDFAGWAHELALFADLEGEAAAIGIVMRFAPLECVRALAADQPLWAQLLARGRYADAQRFAAGVQLGRGVGL